MLINALILVSFAVLIVAMFYINNKSRQCSLDVLDRMSNPHSDLPQKSWPITHNDKE
jgi:hypothetical protein